MKYFIADSHFCHESVIEFDKRPFSSVEEMNRQMIARWNKAVKKPADEVFILGDFLFRGTGEEANGILKKLRGRKFLIRGNHDHFLEDENFDVSLFEWVKDYYTFKEQKRKIVLFHYPILEWEKIYSNAIHLYGHVHNTRSEYFNEVLGPRAVNAGACMLDYAPVSIQQIFQLVEGREKTLENTGK